MAPLVDLDLNCRPPSPEPAAPEELRGVMLSQEQPFPDQMDLPKLYWAQTNLPDGSFWKQSSDAERSNPRSTHEHTMRNFDERGNPDVPSNSNKRTRRSNVEEQNMDVKSSIRRKPDVGVWEKCGYRNVIDLEKPATSDDEVEIVSSSGFGNLASRNGMSQDGSCCVSPENRSLAESGQLCREQNASRVSHGSVGSSETPDCQSPTKPNNTESRHSLIDLNVPLEDSIHVSYVPSQEICSPLILPSSSHHGDFWSSSSKVFQKEYGSNIESLKESSIGVIAPSSAADSSRQVDAACSVQGKGLIDLNVSIGSIDMPSTITSNCTDKVLNNDESEGTVSNNSFSKKNSLQAETFREHPIVGYHHHMLASQDDNNTLLPISTNDEINKVQSPDSETVNYKLLISETPQVDNYVCPRLGASHDGASNPQETVGMLQAETEEGDKMASIAAETLLSILSDNSACAADCPGRNTETAAQGGNDDEPQRSLDSYEEIVLNVDEIRDNGQSTHVIPPDKDGPSCGIKLRRGRGLRNFQREIMPGLVSLSRHEICDDLRAIGYELRKTRSRKTCGDKGSPSTRGRPPKRSSTARN